MDAQNDESRPKSKGSQGKVSPGARKTPTKTPTPKATTPVKSPGGQRTPTLKAFKDDGTKTDAQKLETRESPLEGRASRGSKGSKGRLSRGSRKTPVKMVDEEEENRPFSQAHEEPVTQVEIEPDNQNRDVNATDGQNMTGEQIVPDGDAHGDTDRKDD